MKTTLPNPRLNAKLLTSLGTVLYMTQNELAKAVGIPVSTWYSLVHNPDSVTVKHLLAIANSLHIPVRRFFSAGKTDIIGKREDYITDPYLPCRYDGRVLQEYVSKCTDATWKRAAEATDMSYSRLKDSMLAVRRTPVTRLLVVCHLFGLDPFTILIDPNPAARTEGRKTHHSGDTALYSEVCALRQDVDSLTASLEDLSAKYKALLKAHESLSHRVQVNINTINGGNISNIGIAAESVPSDEG